MEHGSLVEHQYFNLEMKALASITTSKVEQDKLTAKTTG